MMKKLLAVALLLIPSIASAQITVTHTFSTGDTVDATQFNTNFSDLASDALDRTGGAITGTITVSTDQTIDGVDISDYLATNVYSADGGAIADPSFSTVGDTDTGMYFSSANTVAFATGGALRMSVDSSGIDVVAGVQAGSGNVGIIDGTGKIPAISTTYFASVDGSNITGIGGATMLAKTGNYTVTTGDAGKTGFIQVSTAGGDVTITLYASSGNAGRIVHIKKTVAANVLTIDGNSSETIDGATTYIINQQYQSVTLVCDGSNWHIM
tara:strand:- start:3064 stop:3870 length:807 start_codon:yes stop_codon:yes gene_type:complete